LVARSDGFSVGFSVGIFAGFFDGMTDDRHSFRRLTIQIFTAGHRLKICTHERSPCSRYDTKHVVGFQSVNRVIIDCVRSDGHRVILIRR